MRTRARDRSSARISLGRSRMRRRRSGGFGRSAMSVTREATAGSSIEKGGRPRGAGACSRGRPAVRPPVAGCSAPRLAESGSSPVSTRNATGICRRRLTPSFERSVSECAFAVRGEMPSRCPTSSFEHPAAISATTSRCRGVRPAPLWIVVVIMAPEASPTRAREPFLVRCNLGCNPVHRKYISGNISRV